MMLRILWSSAVTTVASLTDMNALFGRFHNFILPLVRGKDRVCSCVCGRQQVHHVVPYNEGQSMVASSGNYYLSDIMTQQERGVIVGLLLGFCISWLLVWLDRVWLKHWRAKQMNDVPFWSWMPKFSNTGVSFGRLDPIHREDYGGNMVHIKQDDYHDVNRHI